MTGEYSKYSLRADLGEQRQGVWEHVELLPRGPDGQDSIHIVSILHEARVVEDSFDGQHGFLGGLVACGGVTSEYVEADERRVYKLVEDAARASGGAWTSESPQGL